LISMAYFSGHIHNIVFEDAVKAFYILRMTLDGNTNPNDKIVVKGHIPGMRVHVGAWFGFNANWVIHKTHGKQLSITKAPVLSGGGWDADTAEQMLISNGVGTSVLRSIRYNYPDDFAFMEALRDVKALETVPGINTFTAEFVARQWKNLVTFFQVMDFLNDLGLPAGKVREVWSTFGDDAQTILSTNPWALVRIEGISFQQADAVAIHLGLDLDSQERVKGAVQYVIKNQRNFGHMYVTTGQLFDDVQELVSDVSKEAVAQALTDSHKVGDLVIDRETRPGVTAVYETWSYNIEKDSADTLKQRAVTASFGKDGLDVLPFIRRMASVGIKTDKEASKKKPDLDKVIKAAIADWGTMENLILSDTQKQGVHNALANPISVLTGLPGTGKTTSLKAVVRILQGAGVRFLLCAPTGIAAKNLSTMTGSPAYTIHRAFLAKGSSEEKRETTYAGIVGESESGNIDIPDKDAKWGYGPEDPHPAEFVIVDEASMLDQHLMYRLLQCTAPDCRLIFVGDAAQLPSVGPGNVLRDLIASNQFPVVSLTEIFRQKDTSDIVYAAHSIFHGKTPECEDSKDFVLVQVQTEEEALKIIERLAVGLYSRKNETFQILSPRHAGTIGVTNLNARLRELLNPLTDGLPEMRFGNDTVRQEDRIMIVKNSYLLKVFNGDMGKVSRIDRKSKDIEVKIFDDPPLFIQLPLKDASKLIRLAYACTVHKAQGLEYDIIVMPLMDSFKQQLQRNLLYTAVTRAKKRVILVGTYSALEKAVINDKEDQRNTLFKDRIMIQKAVMA